MASRTPSRNASRCGCVDSSIRYKPKNRQVQCGWKTGRTAVAIVLRPLSPARKAMCRGAPKVEMAATRFTL
eukprot:scaffold12101_cov110-Isochrysis_galbana.AAC.1